MAASIKHISLTTPDVCELKRTVLWFFSDSPCLSLSGIMAAPRQVAKQFYTIYNATVQNSENIIAVIFSMIKINLDFSRQISRNIS